MNEITRLTPGTSTDQQVRWCAGCGDHAVLKAVQRTMLELGVRPGNKASGEPFKIAEIEAAIEEALA